MEPLHKVDNNKEMVPNGAISLLLSTFVSILVSSTPAN